MVHGSGQFFVIVIPQHTVDWDAAAKALVWLPTIITTTASAEYAILKMFFFMVVLLADAWSGGGCCVAVCAARSELRLHLFLACIVQYSDPGLFYLAMAIDKEKGWRAVDAH